MSRKKYFRKYTIELVKEDDTKYEGKITTPEDAYKKILEIFKLDKKAQEHVVLLCLDMKNMIIGAFLISKGGVNFSCIEVSEVIRSALLCNSKKILLAHNHPSGNTTESKEDILVTKRLKDACALMDIELLDHIIIGDNAYNSIGEKLFLNK